MSTEYFYAELCGCSCPYCPGGRVQRIGISAAGWQFMWDRYEPEDDSDVERVTSLDDARNVYGRAGIIVDEYGRRHTWEELERWALAKLEWNGEPALRPTLSTVDRHGQCFTPRGYVDDGEARWMLALLRNEEER